MIQKRMLLWAPAFAALALAATGYGYSSKPYSPEKAASVFVATAAGQQQQGAGRHLGPGVITLDEMYRLQLNHFGVNVNLQESGTHYYLAVSNFSPSGQFLGHLVDPQTIGHVTLSQSLFGASRNHTFLSIGGSFIALIPKSLAPNGFFYDYKLTIWDVGADWSDEGEAFYNREVGLSPL